MNSSQSVILLLSALAVLAQAQFTEDGYSVVLKSRKNSGPEDDAESYVRCPKSFYIGQCTCYTEARVGCDGAWIRRDKGGEVCVAWNRNNNTDGVFAVAVCQKLILTLNSQVASGPAAIAVCPQKFKLISCALHSYYGQRWPTARARRSGKRCLATKNCKKCRVQARCIRITGYNTQQAIQQAFTDQDEQEE